MTRPRPRAVAAVVRWLTPTPEPEAQRGPQERPCEADGKGRPESCAPPTDAPLAAMERLRARLCDGCPAAVEMDGLIEDRRRALREREAHRLLDAWCEAPSDGLAPEAIEHLRAAVAAAGR